MNQSKIAKTLARGAVVSWRQQPTQYDIEAMRANVERVGLVIRVRWAIVTALAIFSVVAAGVYSRSVDFDVFVSNMIVPALALVFVLLYNAFYQLTYRRLGNISFLNHAQLIFDIIVTTVLVYYSGGVYSWFSSMYLLFILEGAFILPKRSHVWLLTGISAYLYGLVVFGEFWGWIPHVSMPFVDNALHQNLTYVLVRYLWKVTLYGGAATIGLLMMKRIHDRERELRETSFVDELTGLYNRGYFQRVLRTECERARRNDRKLALVLADVYQFGEFNRMFGVEVGDEMLAAIAGRLREAARADAPDANYDVNIACRIGGEELALIVPEVARRADDTTALEDRALATAEHFRAAVESTRVSGVSVTASVGVSIMPTDGETPAALIDSADRMLSLAARRGGNTVCASWLEDADPDADL